MTLSLNTCANGGRGTDGHQLRTSLTKATLSRTDKPGHGRFIAYPIGDNDWRSPKNDNLWQGVSGINNPCPSGYRLPTETELNDERASWSTQNSTGAFASPLKLTMGGARNAHDGFLTAAGEYGAYWCSSVSGGLVRNLGFDRSKANMDASSRSSAASVRCIKD